MTPFLIGFELLNTQKTIMKNPMNLRMMAEYLKKAVLVGLPAFWSFWLRGKNLPLNYLRQKDSDGVQGLDCFHIHSWFDIKFTDRCSHWCHSKAELLWQFLVECVSILDFSYSDMMFGEFLKLKLDTKYLNVTWLLLDKAISIWSLLSLQ